MHWREAGSGEPIVFLHAFPFNSGMWEGQLSALPPGWRGIAPDLRGFGRTPATGAGPLLMEDFADDVIALLDHLQLPTAVLCGLSMGGYIALAAHRKYADRIRGLILSDTRATADTEEGKQARAQLAAKVRAEGAQAVVGSMLPKLLSDETHKSRPELVGEVQQMMMTASPESVARALEGMAARPTSEDLFSSIHCNVLIIHGDDDAVIPRGDAQMMARGIRGARIQLVDDAGHLPNLERPDVFNRFVGDFLGHLPPNYGSLKFA